MVLKQSPNCLIENDKIQHSQHKNHNVYHPVKNYEECKERIGLTTRRKISQWKQTVNDRDDVQ